MRGLIAACCLCEVPEKASTSAPISARVATSADPASTALRRHQGNTDAATGV